MQRDITQLTCEQASSFQDHFKPEQEAPTHHDVCVPPARAAATGRSHSTAMALSHTALVALAITTTLLAFAQVCWHEGLVGRSAACLQQAVRQVHASRHSRLQAAAGMPEMSSPPRPQQAMHICAGYHRACPPHSPARPLPPQVASAIHPPAGPPSA